MPSKSTAHLTQQSSISTFQLVVTLLLLVAVLVICGYFLWSDTNVKTSKDSRKDETASGGERQYQYLLLESDGLDQPLEISELGPPKECSLPSTFTEAVNKSFIPPTQLLASVCSPSICATQAQAVSDYCKAFYQQTTCESTTSPVTTVAPAQCSIPEVSISTTTVRTKQDASGAVTTSTLSTTSSPVKIENEPSSTSTSTLSSSTPVSASVDKPKKTASAQMVSQCLVKPIKEDQKILPEMVEDIGAFCRETLKKQQDQLNMLESIKQGNVVSPPPPTETIRKETVTKLRTASATASSERSDFGKLHEILERATQLQQGDPTKATKSERKVRFNLPGETSKLDLSLGPKSEGYRQPTTPPQPFQWEPQQNVLEQVPGGSQKGELFYSKAPSEYYPEYSQFEHEEFTPESPQQSPHESPVW